jgi:hypothetical protein
MAREPVRAPLTRLVTGAVKARIALLIACTCLASCAGSALRPSLAPSARKRDAVLVLPGFGYGRSGERAFRSLAATAANEGLDVYVPTYVTRSGLATSRAKLERFIRDQRLDRYERVHVFAFLAGGWTLNPLLEANALPNLATIVYDRSVYQERAARIADEHLHFLTWVRYGSTVFDFAHTPYPALGRSDVRIALMVEMTPTPLVLRYMRAGLTFDQNELACNSFGQHYDDCAYIPFDHGELYTHFTELWPELRAFIRTGQFTAGARRQP